jgi:hypothetical protein
MFVPVATFGQLIRNVFDRGVVPTLHPPIDFSGMDDVWQVYARPCALAKLVGEALQVEKSESGGGLICWDGKKYVWQQRVS